MKRMMTRSVNTQNLAYTLTLKPKVDLILPEGADTGEIKPRDWKNFFDFSYGCSGIITLFLVCLFTSILQLLPSLWLTEWLDGDIDEQQKDIYPIVYGTMIGVYILFTMIRSIAIFQIILKSSTNLHNAMVDRVLRANILFFDSNPIGRVVTRFSKDLVVFDLIMPILVIIIVQGFFRTGTVVIIISVVNPWMLVLVAFCAVMMYFTMKKGSRVMIEAQRRDAESRGPVHGTFAMVVNGMVSLRASDKIKFFRQDFINNLEYGTNATFSYVIANRWIGIRLDTLAVIFISFVSLFVVMNKGEIESSYLVMSLQVASDVIFLFSISFRMFAEAENYMTSSQRMIAYTKLDQEDDLVKPEDAELEKKNWPSEG